MTKRHRVKKHGIKHPSMRRVFNGRGYGLQHSDPIPTKRRAQRLAKAKRGGLKRQHPTFDFKYRITKTKQGYWIYMVGKKKK